jgi:S-adenosylmethionine hydrolase
MGGRVVTLTTDFGSTDGYAGAVKGVLLTEAPELSLVDVTHEVRPGDVLQAAWILATTWRHFPQQTTHLAVVDPDVGSGRKPLAIAADGHFFVGPDNGLFTLVVDAARSLRAVELTNRSLWRQPPSPVFHGRDIFAPVAAALARGVPLEDVGHEIEAVQALPRAKPRRGPGGELTAHIVHIDRFGNCVTDVRAEDLPPGDLRLRHGAHTIEELVHYYAEAPAGRVVALINSSGYVELALRGGSAEQQLEARRGDEILIWP